MTKNEFKIGDRVIIKGSHEICTGKDCYCTFTNEPGEITEVRDDKVEAMFDICGELLWLSATEVELIPPPDRRKAFLSRLQDLLREFNVFLIAHKTDMPISVYFNNAGEDMPFASIGEEVNKGCGVVITADNIMDFEKE